MCRLECQDHSGGMTSRHAKSCIEMQRSEEKKINKSTASMENLAFVVFYAPRIVFLFLWRDMMKRSIIKQGCLNVFIYGMFWADFLTKQIQGNALIGMQHAVLMSKH